MPEEKKEEVVLVDAKQGNKWYLLFFGTNILQLLLTIVNPAKWGENPRAVAMTFLLIAGIVANIFWGYIISEEMKLIILPILTAVIGFALRKWKIPVKEIKE